MRRLSALLIIATATPSAVTATTCTSVFDAPVSARSLAMGGAFVAVADDAAAVAVNPAALSGLKSMAFLATWSKPACGDDSDEGFGAIAAPTRYGAFGASFYTKRGADGAVFCFARDIRRTLEDASLSVGAAVNWTRLEEAGKSADAWSGSASVMLRPFATIGAGYVVGNLAEPTFDGLSSQPETHLTHSYGLSYLWQGILLVSLENRRGVDERWRGMGGMELRFGRRAKMRAGIDGSHTTMGVGFHWKGLGVDFATRSHQIEGPDYLISIGYHEVTSLLSNAQTD